jgi:hypothetical protein
MLELKRSVLGASALRGKKKPRPKPGLVSQKGEHTPEQFTCRRAERNWQRGKDAAAFFRSVLGLPF